MTHIKQNLGSIALGALIVLMGLIGIASMSQHTPIADASVARFAEYNATTTRAANTGAAMANLQVIQSGPGTLGSVVITGLGTGTINFYDGTSTVTNTQWATTSLAVFPASTAAGVYTFDVLFTKGLLVEISGAVATSTITYRAN